MGWLCITPAFSNFSWLTFDMGVLFPCFRRTLLSNYVTLEIKLLLVVVVVVVSKND